MEMTVKERLLGSIRRQTVDRVPWSPFLAYWWEYQDSSITEKGQLAFLEELGADPLLRGYKSLFTVKYNACEEIETVRGTKKQTRLCTPVGTLTSVHTYVEHANTWFLTEHPVKTAEDFKILTYLADHMIINPDYSLEKEAEIIGGRALLMPQISPFGKSSFQALLEHYVGTEELVYAIMDYPQTVEECLQSMRKQTMRAAEISADSKLESFIFWEDSSTTNISPAMFERFTAPEISAWAAILHRENKLLVHHACGHIRDLLPGMAVTGIDCVESISPPPTGNVELWDAQKAIGETVSLIGGIEPTVFMNSTKEQLEEYVHHLLNQMDWKGFVLANSDSCPPDVVLDKFYQVTQLLKKRFEV